MPLIDIQRRLVEVGRIRMGERNDRGFPVRLEQWKLTSRDQVRLRAAAGVYGGKVQRWDGHDGQFELHTEVEELPILLMPGQTISQFYELWSGGGCKRRCDGEIEQLTDGPCMCDPGARECKPITRLNVLLPDVPGIGCWRLDSTGWNAAHELAGSVDLLEMATVRGVLLPARLRIDQRTAIRNGQTMHFPVPTLDIDVRPLELVAITRGRTPSGGGDEIASESRPELPPAELPYTPLPRPPQSGVSVDEGLAAAAALADPPKTRSARNQQAPMPEEALEDFESAEPIPVPVEPDSVKAPDEGWTLDLTEKQWKKLNVLVGQLRERIDPQTQQPVLQTKHLYSAIAIARNTAVELLAEEVGGLDADGVLHWGPLRDSLSFDEASSLIDRLERYDANTRAA